MVADVGKDETGQNDLIHHLLESSPDFSVGSKATLPNAKSVALRLLRLKFLILSRNIWNYGTSFPCKLVSNQPSTRYLTDQQSYNHLRLGSLINHLVTGEINQFAASPIV